MKISKMTGCNESELNNNKMELKFIPLPTCEPSLIMEL